MASPDPDPQPVTHDEMKCECPVCSLIRQKYVEFNMEAVLQEEEGCWSIHSETNARATMKDVYELFIRALRNIETPEEGKEYTLIYTSLLINLSCVSKSHFRFHIVAPYKKDN